MKVMRISRQPYTIQFMLDQQLENVVHFNYVGSMTTNDTRCICEIKSRIAIAKAAFNKKEAFDQQIGLQFKEETSKVLHME